jgi:hypothetical protein
MMPVVISHRKPQACPALRLTPSPLCTPGCAPKGVAVRKRPSESEGLACGTDAAQRAATLPTAFVPRLNVETVMNLHAVDRSPVAVGVGL